MSKSAALDGAAATPPQEEVFPLAFFGWAVLAGLFYALGATYAALAVLAVGLAPLPVLLLRTGRATGKTGCGQAQDALKAG